MLAFDCPVRFVEDGTTVEIVGLSPPKKKQHNTLFFCPHLDMKVRLWIDKCRLAGTTKEAEMTLTLFLELTPVPSEHSACRNDTLHRLP